MTDNRRPEEILSSMSTDDAPRGVSRSHVDSQHRPDMGHPHPFPPGHADHYYKIRPEHLHVRQYSCPSRLRHQDVCCTLHEPCYLHYPYPSPKHFSENHHNIQHPNSHLENVRQHWQTQVPEFGLYSHGLNRSTHYAHLSAEAFSSSCGDDHFPGTTPPQTGDDDEYPRSFDSDGLHISPLPHQPPDEYKPDCTALNPNEGFESPDSNQVYGKSTGESPDHFYDDRKGASVPQSIYLKSDNTFTPSPETMPNHESPVEAFHLAHPIEPPPLPIYHQADANKSDFANSSSNSSSHTENGGENGWTKHYNSLVRYWKENGHCNVPQKYQDVENDLNLGVWVNKVSEKRVADFPG